MTNQDLNTCSKAIELRPPIHSDKLQNKLVDSKDFQIAYSVEIFLRFLTIYVNFNISLVFQLKLSF